MKPLARIIVTKWIFTVLFILPLLGSGAGYLLAARPIVEGMAHLGYPFYLIRFLGVAKILGSAAVLTGIFPRIKEWAYAGFTFNLLGAAYSHLCSGDGPKALAPLIILAFGAVSYFYWHKSSGAKAGEPTGHSTPFN